MNIALKTAIEVRKELQNIEDSYNTEDGQIRWLEDNEYDIHLGSFYTIIPQEIKKKMTLWNVMALPLKRATEVRKELHNIEDSYNTEDGQIRWLEDNKYNINLGNFYTIIPQEIKKKMTLWKYMDVALKTAIEVRKELQHIEDSYNTEDGQIRWLEDHKYDIHLRSFYTIIPQEIKNKMTMWNKMNVTFLDAKKGISL